MSLYSEKMIIPLINEYATIDLRSSLLKSENVVLTNEFLSTKLYSFGMMVNGPKSTDVAERHTIFCVDHDSF